MLTFYLGNHFADDMVSVIITPCRGFTGPVELSSLLDSGAEIHLGHHIH